MSQTNTSNMFFRCDELVLPSSDDIALIEVGNDWVGTGCPVESTLYVQVDIIHETSSIASIEVDAIHYIDWGDGTVIEYPAGTSVSPLGLYSGTMTITSYMAPTKIRFHNSPYTSISIYKGTTLTTIDDIARDCGSLASFTFNGLNHVTSAARAFMNDGGLKKVNIYQLGNVTNFTQMFQNSMFPGGNIQYLNTANGEIFDDMFAACWCTCVAQLNTLNQTSTTNMFGDNATSAFVTPGEAERTALLAGDNWVNMTECAQDN